MAYQNCGGGHDGYVAEVVYVAQEGKLVVVTVCRSCDSVHFHEKQIAAPHTQAVLLKNENAKENKL